MKYKNTKTGAVIDSPCVIKGNNWIEVKEEIKEEVKKQIKAIKSKAKE